MPCFEALPLAVQPLIEQRTLFDVQSFQQLAVHELHESAQIGGSTCCERAFDGCTKLQCICLCILEIQRNTFVVGNDARSQIRIEYSPHLGEMPTQFGAGIVGIRPEEFA